MQRPWVKMKMPKLFADRAKKLIKMLGQNKGLDEAKGT